MLRRLTLATALLALLAPAAGAAPSRRLIMNGDSLAVGTRPYLSSFLPGWRVTTSASISRHADDGADVLRSVGSLPRVVAVSLGTNDDPRRTASFRASIDETMRVAGPRRCVVWANIVRPPVGGASYAGMNHVLGAEARRRRNLRWVNWVRLVRRHREWLADDGVHVNADGYRARASAFARVARRCHR